jgi:pimeloyl-ACP methyl ester carboxylesterase
MRPKCVWHADFELVFHTEPSQSSRAAGRDEVALAHIPPNHDPIRWNDGLPRLQGISPSSRAVPSSTQGSPIEAEYKRLSPTSDAFPTFVQRVVAIALKPYDFGADKIKATQAPMFFIHGDADGVRLEHISEMFRLKGGDLGPRSASRLAILPNTTHVTLMERTSVLVPMVNDFLDAKPEKH